LLCSCSAPLLYSLPYLPSFPTRRSSDLGFIFVAQTFEDLHALFHRRRVHSDGLEAARKRGIFFNVFAVFIQRGRANALNFTAGKDRKSTRLNSSHVKISYAVFCLKKKKI